MNHDNTDNNRLANPFDQHRDDETTGYNTVVIGQVGSGKTRRFKTAYIRRHLMDPPETEAADEVPHIEGETDDTVDANETGDTHQ